jgi:hypothetical protein
MLATEKRHRHYADGGENGHSMETFGERGQWMAFFFDLLPSARPRAKSPPTLPRPKQLTATPRKYALAPAARMFRCSRSVPGATICKNSAAARRKGNHHHSQRWQRNAYRLCFTSLMSTRRSAKVNVAKLIKILFSSFIVQRCSDRNVCYQA